MTTQRPTPITFDEIQKLGGALHKLRELGDSKIISAEAAAEKRGLQQYITETLTLHSSELIACWLAMHNEYEPLIMGFVGLLSRANGVLSAQAQMREGRSQQQTDQEHPIDPTDDQGPDNVIQLK